MKYPSWFTKFNLRSDEIKKTTLHRKQFDIVTYCTDYTAKIDRVLLREVVTLTASGSISDAMYVSNSNPSSFNTRSPLEARENVGGEREGEGEGEGGNKEEREGEGGGRKEEEEKLMNGGLHQTFSELNKKLSLLLIGKCLEGGALCMPFSEYRCTQSLL